MEETNFLEQLVQQYEEKLSYKVSGNLGQRIENCLRQYRQIADNALWKSKEFMDDCRHYFKALEILVGGLTSDGMNHGQKRTVANYLIMQLREMVDRINQTSYEYSTNNFDRYDFFRSQTPEKRLHERYQEISHKQKQDESRLKALEEKFPDVYKQLIESEIPF